MAPQAREKNEKYLSGGSGSFHCIFFLDALNLFVLVVDLSLDLGLV